MTTSWNDDTAIVAPPVKITASALSECSTQIFAVLQRYPAVYVTAGWIEDRGLGYKEHTIAVALRKLAQAKKVDHIFELGFRRYAYHTDLVSLQAAREKNKSKRKRKHGKDNAI